MIAGRPRVHKMAVFSYHFAVCNEKIENGPGFWDPKRRFSETSRTSSMAPKNRVSIKRWIFNDLIFVRNFKHNLALWDYAFLCTGHPFRGHPASIFLGLGAKRYYFMHNYPFFYNWSPATKASQPKCIRQSSPRGQNPLDNQRPHTFQIFEAVEICRNFFDLACKHLPWI